MGSEDRSLLRGELLDRIAHRGIVVAADDEAGKPAYPAGIEKPRTQFS